MQNHIPYSGIKSKSSLEKALDILLLFDEERKLLGINEISRLLKMPPSSVQRLVNVLKKKGFLAQDAQTRKYKLGTIFLKFAGFVRESLDIAKVSYPVMQKLSRETGETVHLNVIDNWERVCIETIESTKPLMARMPVGHRSPLYSGASSKCLLAFSSEDFIEEYLNSIELTRICENTIIDKNAFMKELEKIRRAGYAESFSERVKGLGALSAPVFGYDRRLIASLSLAIPEVRFRDRRLKQLYVDKLVESAKEISSLLGYQTVEG